MLTLIVVWMFVDVFLKKWLLATLWCGLILFNSYKSLVLLIKFWVVRRDNFSTQLWTSVSFDKLGFYLYFDWPLKDQNKFERSK